jgi:hypothetical protein
MEANNRSPCGQPDSVTRCPNWTRCQRLALACPTFYGFVVGGDVLKYRTVAYEQAREQRRRKAERAGRTFKAVHEYKPTAPLRGPPREPTREIYEMLFGKFTPTENDDDRTDDARPDQRDPRPDQRAQRSEGSPAAARHYGLVGAYQFAADLARDQEAADALDAERARRGASQPCPAAGPVPARG